MFKKVMFTTLFVSDQDKALDFYTRMFGFEKRADNPGPEGRFLTIGLGSGQDVLLWPGTAGKGLPGAPGQPPHAVPGPLFLESDDLRKDFVELQSRGVDFAGAEPLDYAYGVRVDAVDPDGNRISLRQPRRWP